MFLKPHKLIDALMYGEKNSTPNILNYSRRWNNNRADMIPSLYARARFNQVLLCFITSYVTLAKKAPSDFYFYFYFSSHTFGFYLSLLNWYFIFLRQIAYLQKLCSLALNISPRQVTGLLYRYEH